MVMTAGSDGTITSAQFIVGRRFLTVIISNGIIEISSNHIDTI